MKLDGELLRLLQQVLRAHRRFDRIQHDPDRLRQLLEKRQVGGREGRKRRQLDDGFGFSLEQYRQHDNVCGRRAAEAGLNDVIGGDVLQQNALFFDSALPHQTAPQLDSQGLIVTHRITGQQPQRRCRHNISRFDRLHLVNRSLLDIHKGRQFREKHFADGDEIALALQHSGKPGQIGFEPVLLVVALRRRAQVIDHRIDVVF